MNKKLKVINIQQANVGRVQFAEFGLDNVKNKTGSLVTVEFRDPKDAAKFEHGKEYTVSITPAK